MIDLNIFQYVTELISQKSVFKDIYSICICIVQFVTSRLQFITSDTKYPGTVLKNFNMSYILLSRE